MTNSIKPLIFLLILLAAGLFTYGIFLAGINSLKGVHEIPSFFSNAVIVISGVLSTNFGAVLGISLKPPQLAPAASFMGLRPTGLSAKGPSNSQASVAGNINPIEPDLSQKLQVIACWIYILGLLAGTVFYIIALANGQKDEDIVPLITEISKTLMGVIVGVLGVALSR